MHVITSFQAEDRIARCPGEQPDKALKLLSFQAAIVRMENTRLEARSAEKIDGINTFGIGVADILAQGGDGGGSKRGHGDLNRC